MKKTFGEQINFTIERNNLITFHQFFEGRKDINFPKPIPKYSSESILVEEFVEGRPVTFYENN